MGQGLCRSPRGSADWNFTFPGTRVILNVAPLVGARIEIIRRWFLSHWLRCRSPCGSAGWNPTWAPRRGYGQGRSPRGSADWNCWQDFGGCPEAVAPLAGARIEICKRPRICRIRRRRSPRGSANWNLWYQLHPAGLRLSLPSRERELKSYRTRSARREEWSLPSRERGLKCLWALSLVTRLTVAPLAGAWIEIAYKLLGYKNVYVAPLAWVWIEMSPTWIPKSSRASLPLRERRLK